MALLTPRRRAWTAVGLITALAAMSAGAWGLHRWQPFADEQRPVSWPKNVRALAEFVESTTRLRFIHTVHIEFVPDATDFARRAGADQPPTPQQLALAKDDEALGRALGLWSGDTAIDEPPSKPSTTGHAALWLRDDETLLVKAKSETSSLDASSRAEVVRELTRALDQQRFDTTALYTGARTAQSRLVAVALDLGHAIWVSDEYQLDNDTPSYPSWYRGAPGDLPRAYETLQSAPATIGAAFIEAMYETRRHFVADALSDDHPDAIDQMVQPATKYLQRDRLETVQAPPAPTGGTLIAERQLGHTGLFLMLATGLSPHEALTAADGWGDDAATMYRLGGRVCVDVHLVADSRDDADRIADGLDAWAATRPQQSDARVGRQGLDLYATACDPGAQVRQRVPEDEASDLYLSRVAAIRTLANVTGRADVAECMAVRYYQDHSDPIFAWDLQADPTGDLGQLRDECRASL